MKTDDYGHITVFLQQAVAGLDVHPDGVYVDATLGGGGHSDLILQEAVNGHLYSFDQDQEAIRFNETRFADQIADGRMTLIHSNFKNLAAELHQRGVTQIDGIVFDLGVSSPQFDEQDRGFSYRSDARLDMRMDQEQKLDAYEIVNHWDFKQLAGILSRYGEEKFAAAIARRIVLTREQTAIETTEQLVDVIKEALPDRVLHAKGHPAKKTFQAIRIAVNDELTVLEEALRQAVDLLAPKGRIAVITFQSLEDRIVKRFFREMATKNQLPDKLPVLDKDINEDFRLITRHPIVPTEKEISENRRSHSAKLRILEKN